MPTLMAPNLAFRAAVNGSSNATAQESAGAELIATFALADSKSIRMSTVILASFNVLAAVATAARILYDCYWASKRSSRSFKASKFFIMSLHPAETFPLILAIGIAVQGLVFAGVQGTGLKSLATTGCTTIAQFMWPALFIVPYIQVVFGLECAIRSLRAKPFMARGKYDVAICCGVITVMLIGTWVHSHVVPENNTCFASLVWYISRYGKVGLILLSTSAGIMMFSAITIFIRLSMVKIIDKQQRIAASRIVYYHVLGIVSLAFVIPYFVSQTVAHGSIKLSMMAEVVLNLSGLIGGLLQLFLRSKTAALSFEIGKVGPWAHGKHDVGMSGFNEVSINKELVSPLSGPRTPRELDGRPESRAGLISPQRGRLMSMESLRNFSFRSPLEDDRASPKRVESKPELHGISESITETSSQAAKRIHVRKPSYSLFPTKETSPVKTVPPTLQIEPTSKYPTQREPHYNIDELKPPEPIYFGDEGRGHRRFSSAVSSATVQIGLRISQAPPQPHEAGQLPDSLPSTTHNANTQSPTSPLSPKLIPIALSLRPVSPPIFSRRPIGPSPLRTNIPPPPQSPTRMTNSNKTLPPTPKSVTFNLAGRTDSTTQLSPVVYSPQKKGVSSPKTPGASSSATPRSGASPSVMIPKRPSLKNSPRAEVQPRSDAPVKPRPGSKAGWI